MISRSTRNATSSSAGRPQKSLNSYAFATLVVTFSARNIVASGKYSRGSCDSKPGFHAECFSDGELIFMAQPRTVGSTSCANNTALQLESNETAVHTLHRRVPTFFP